MFASDIMLILTIERLEGISGAGRVRDDHPVGASTLWPPPGPDIDEGIGGPAIVTAIRG